LKEWFRKHEYRTCKTDTCIFKKKTETGDDITIIVYVDDLFIIVKTEDQYQKILMFWYMTKRTTYFDTLLLLV